MKCGQIFLVDFPFTDASGSKVRPVLVVSADRYNRDDDVVVVPISSAPDLDDPHAHLLRSSDPTFKPTRLRQTSSVKWTKPMTISRRVVRRRLGYIASGALVEIRARIQEVFGS